MVDGMIELFDDFCDLALSRIYNSTHGIRGGFDFDALCPEEISRFKITWIICLSELMFFSMKDQPNLEPLKAHFREVLNLEAQERALETFIKQALIRVPEVIEEDKDFVVNFKDPQLAITPWQSIVFYSDDILVGGGIIKLYD